MIKRFLSTLNAVVNLILMCCFLKRVAKTKENGVLKDKCWCDSNDMHPSFTPIWKFDPNWKQRDIIG